MAAGKLRALLAAVSHVSADHEQVVSDSSDSDDEEASQDVLGRRQLRRLSAALLGSGAAAVVLETPLQQLTGVLLSLGGLMAQQTGACLQQGDQVGWPPAAMPLLTCMS